MFSNLAFNKFRENNYLRKVSPIIFRQISLILLKRITKFFVSEISRHCCDTFIPYSTPPTDTLHRETLINSALVPLYNHVLMALPVTETELDPLHKEILSFLWTRSDNQETIQKRRLVAAKRLSASFDKGGLQIQHPMETAEGLRLNLIQKCFKRITEENGSTFTRILEEMLRQKRLPDLITHVNTLGPTEWVTTGNRIMSKNRMVGMAFQTIAGYLTKLEDTVALKTGISR